DFSSDTYKRLPSVGTITVADPFTGAFHRYKMPAGGRGYTRPPSLIALWSTAPFLLNNTVGPHPPKPYDYGPRMTQAEAEAYGWRSLAGGDGQPYAATALVGVADRMKVFDSSIEQMLWPEKREQDLVFSDGRVHGRIDRTTDVSWLVIAPAFVPDNLK